MERVALADSLGLAVLLETFLAFSSQQHTFSFRPSRPDKGTVVLLARVHMFC